MTEKIIITDLTRFSEGNDDACLAGVDVESKSKCIRPMPYLTKAQIIKLAIVPGEVLSGDFLKKTTHLPHVEDVDRKPGTKLKRFGQCSSDDFEEVLKNTSKTSLLNGFENKIKEGSRVIPAETPPCRSIVTLVLKPKQIEIIKDGYGKFKLHLNDNDGRRYPYMPIADLGFYLRLESNTRDAGYIDTVNSFIYRQSKLYLRVGLAREWRGGFWMQINGIYTFPHFLPAVRSYPD